MNRKDQSAAGADVLTRNAEPTLADSSTSKATGGLHEKARLFDSSIVGTGKEAVDFITNILESSTEYSVIAKDLAGKILLWNEGAETSAFDGRVDSVRIASLSTFCPPR